MEPAFREAIQQGNIQIPDAYSTDPEIAQYDPSCSSMTNTSPTLPVSTLMKGKLFLRNIQNWRLYKLSGKTPQRAKMSQMNYQVGVEGKAAKVARDFFGQTGDYWRNDAARGNTSRFLRPLCTQRTKLAQSENKLEDLYRLFWSNGQQRRMLSWL